MVERCPNVQVRHGVWLRGSPWRDAGVVEVPQSMAVGDIQVAVGEVQIQIQVFHYQCSIYLALLQVLYEDDEPEWANIEDGFGPFLGVWSQERLDESPA